MTGPSTKTPAELPVRPSLTHPLVTHPLLTIDAAILEQARLFFEGCGTRGTEGTALIAGTRLGPDRLRGHRLVVPDQVATPVPRASVTVTAAGDLELVSALEADETYLARIHSHPGEAFHSPTDDANPVLTHDGAISIVVPFFGLGLRLGLKVCAIYVRERSRWRELDAEDPEREAWVQVDG